MGARVPVTPTLICALNSLAMEGVAARAGQYSQEEKKITGTEHKPPPFKDIPQLIEECCDYLNQPERTALHAAAYALWRVNWIHPFDDGNGRTARALCYLVYCERSGAIPRGTPTLIDRISQEKIKHYRLLREADLPWERGRRVRLANLEGFLHRLIKAQIASAT